MIFFTTRLAAVLLACTVLIGCGTQDTLSDAYGPTRSLVQITEDIYRFFDNDHSSLFVLTDEGIVLIDPLNVGASEWVKKEIESRFDIPVTHILYSHGHYDHASGASVFGDVEVISHANTFSVVRPSADLSLTRDYVAYDSNGNGVVELSEADSDLLRDFAELDTNSDGVITGQETGAYINRNIMLPTQTYSSRINRMRIGGKLIEMHFVGGNHAADMSYIFFPEESIVFYVDVISLGAIPWGPLAWYSKEDSENTYAVALSIGADIAIPSHGPIGTQEDVRGLQQYMADLRERVIEKMDAGQSLEQIQASIDMQDYADWDYFEGRIADNILGMHRVLTQERASQ